MSGKKEKFTAGPWYLNPEMDLIPSEPCIYCGYKPDFFEPQESIVAEVGNKEGNIIATARKYSILEPTDEEVMANAALIAAAPEMYEELVKTAGFLRFVAKWIEKIHGVIAIGETMKYRADRLQGQLPPSICKGDA